MNRRVPADDCVNPRVINIFDSRTSSYLKANGSELDQKPSRAYFSYLHSNPVEKVDAITLERV